LKTDISNRNSEDENEKICPAIECRDAHSEYWENGLLHRDDGPAVISAGDNKIEYWKKGKKDNSKNKNYFFTDSEEKKFERGKEAEKAFAKYLNDNDVPFLHIDQRPEFYSYLDKEKNIKRPDYIVCIDNKIFFVDVKAKSNKAFDINELDRYNNLQKDYSIDLLFAITDINQKEYRYFSFLPLVNIMNYIEICKSHIKESNGEIFDYPDALLSKKIDFEVIEQDKLQKIATNEIQPNKNIFYFYSDILKEYLKHNNYKMERGT